jgi:hypothetical protein
MHFISLTVTAITIKKSRPTALLPKLLCWLLLILTQTPSLPASNLLYLRLKVELQTTAERAAFNFENADSILTSRLASTQGPLSSKGWTLRRFWVRSAQDGATVSATTAYALSEEALSEPFPFFLEKSEKGESLLRISIIDKAGQAHLLKEWRQAGAANLEDSLDLAHTTSSDILLLSVIPLAGQPALVAPQKMLLAFYYLWYGLSDWYSPYLQDFPLTPYSSSDPAALARHIDQAKSAGVQGFIASWWGPDNSIDRNFQTLLDTAWDKNFKIALYFETMAADGPRDEVTILEWLRYALSRYGNHPAFFKVGGKPVIVIWVSFTVKLEVWDRIFRQLRSEGLDAVFIGAYDSAEPELDLLDVFDGLHNYNILGIVNRNEEVPDILARAYEETGRAVHYYPLLADIPSLKIWTATVQPGFDDRLIPGRQTPLLPRLDGGLYQATWEAALASQPDWILITTWNEWWENTQIEPGRLYGDQYLAMTWDRYRAWRTKTAGPPY